MSDTEQETQFEAPEIEPEPDEDQTPDETRERIESPQDNPDTQQGGTEARDDREVDAVYAKIGTKAKNYAKGVAELDGIDGLPLLVCELCSDAYPGFRWAQPRTDEAVAAVSAFHGTQDLDSLKQADWAKRCESCGGRGWVKTASLVTGNEAIVCRKCNGAGYTVLDSDNRYEVPPAPTNGGTVPAQLPGVNTDDPRVRELAAQGWTMIPPQNLSTVTP